MARTPCTSRAPCTSRRLRFALGILLLAVFSAAPPASAQVGNVTGLFLEAHSQPRAYALGQGTVALRGYTGAIDVNPATIGEAGIVRAGTDVFGAGPVASDWLPNIFDDVTLTTPSVAVKRGRWAAAAQVKVLSDGARVERNPEGEVVDRSGADWAVTASGAYDLRPDLSVGAGAKVIRLRGGAQDQRVVPALDVGVHYHPDFTADGWTIEPALGWSLNDFGPNVDFDDAEPGDLALPMVMRLGGATSVSTPQTWSHRPYVRVTLVGQLSNRLVHSQTVRTADGGVYSDADGPFRTLFSSGWKTADGVILDGEPTQLSVWEQTVRHAGAELSLLDVLTVQWGRFYETKLNGDRQFTTYGFGIDLYYVGIQHAWTDGDGRLNNSFWRLTGRIPLNGDAPTNFWKKIMD